MNTKIGQQCGLTNQSFVVLQYTRYDCTRNAKFIPTILYYQNICNKPIETAVILDLYQVRFKKFKYFVRQKFQAPTHVRGRGYCDFQTQSST